MSNFSSLNSIKKSGVVREVTFAFKPNNAAQDLRRFKRDFCNLFSKVNKNIQDKLEHISMNTTLIPTKIEVKFTDPAVPDFQENISEIFDSIYNCSKLRVLINFEHIDSHGLNELLDKDSNISHLIELSFVDHFANDLNQYNSPSSTIYVNSSEKAVNIVEDIMLDIAMYYTVFTDNMIENIEFRKKFSHHKINEIKKRKLNSKIWNLDKDFGYISIASYFRNKREFNFEEYINTWESIGNELNIYEQNAKSVDIMSQLKNHTEIGELPIKSIVRAYDNLLLGEHILVRLIKIPVKKKSQRSLITLFGGKVLKRGRWKFIPKADLSYFERFDVNVSIFKIMK